MVKQVTVVWIFATLPLMTAFAHSKKAQLQRTISIELRDPRRSFDSNTAAWQALNQSIALGFDAFSESSRMQESLWCRAASFTAGLWTNVALRFYSHEAAHEIIYRGKNIDIRTSLDLQNWKSSYIPGFYYPGWEQSQINPQLLSDEELIVATIAGLVQDELNAETVWRTSVARAAVSYYDAQSFLLTKIRDLEYITTSGSDEAPFAPGQPMHQLHQHVHSETPHLFDDVNLYRLALLNAGIEISNRQLLHRALFADVLSWHTWQSAWSLVSYLTRGSPSVRLLTLHLNDNITILPPLFSHYMTMAGSFFNSSYMINIDNAQLQIDIGSMIGFSDIEPFRHYRFGLKAFMLKMTPFWSAQPYIFINGHSGLNIDGISAGLDTFISLSSHLAISVKIEYNENDIIENLVKREKNGLHSGLGFRTAF